MRPAHGVEAPLTFEGLRLAAIPPEPSLLDRVLWHLGLDGLDQASAYAALLDTCAEQVN